MTPDERVTMYVNYLAKEGYRPSVEGDGTLVAFKHEGGSYVIVVDETDEAYFQLIYPNFWTIRSEQDRIRALRCADEVTSGLKVAKVYLVQDGTNVYADVEEFLPRPPDFEAIFPRALQVLRQAVGRFTEKMNMT